MCETDIKLLGSVVTLMDSCNAVRLETKGFHYFKLSGAKQPMLTTLGHCIRKLGVSIELQSIHEVSYAWPALGAILNHCEISFSGAGIRTVAQYHRLQ